MKAQGGRGKKQLNAQNLQGIQLISMSRQEREMRRGKGGGDTGCGLGDYGPVMGEAEAWRRRGWGSRGDCRLPGGLEEIHAALLGVGGSSSRDSPSTSSAIGGERRQQAWGFTSSVFPYPPLSHSLFVALFSGVSSLLQLQDRIEMKLQTRKRLHLNHVEWNT